jgi:hypothetical protein
MRYSELIFSVLVLWVFVLQGAEFRSGKNIYINTADSVAADLFASGQYVEINAPVSDDIYAVCQEIIVNDEVGDDLLAFCQSVTVKGHVKDMVLGFAQKITIDNTVDDDVLAFGSEVHLTKNAHIKGDLFIGCGTLSIDGGKIDGNINGGSGTIYLNGTVGGDVNLSVGNIEFGDEYNAMGVTSLTLHQEFDEELKNKPENIKITIEEKDYFFNTIFFFWSFVTTFVVGILMIIFFKDFSKELTLFSHREAMKNSTIGSILLFIIPIFITILTALFITIPVALMFMALYLFLLYISTIISALFLGTYLLDRINKNGRSMNLILSLLIGLIIIFLIIETPYIGWIFSFISIILGMGTFIMYFYHKFSEKEQLV